MTDDTINLAAEEKRWRQYAEQPSMGPNVPYAGLLEESKRNARMILRMCAALRAAVALRHKAISITDIYVVDPNTMSTLDEALRGIEVGDEASDG